MLRQRARSLRLKLALWFVLVFTLVQLSLFALVAFARRNEFRESWPSGAARSAEAMADNILVAEPSWDEVDLAALAPARARFACCALRDAEGELVATWNVREADALPFSDWERRPSGPLVPVFTRLVPEQARRACGLDLPLVVVTLQFQSAERRHFLQVAVRDRPFDRMRGPFFDLARVGIPVGILAALAAAWWIAGRAVAPIRALSDAARSLGPDVPDPSLRIPTTDDEVRMLQEELNSALLRLQAGYEAQERFISDVAHELKTPIAVLLTQAQVTRMGGSEQSSLDFVAEVEREMQRLGRLVESFLGLARAGITQAVPSESLSTSDLVLDALRDCRWLAAQRSVLLLPRLPEAAEDGPEAELRGDPQLLRTMLENLIRNAIRHSPPTVAVEVEVELRAEETAFNVRDRGPGIPEEDLGRIFERFVTIARDGRSSEGSGLGLSIALQIARLHGGTIEAANAPGGGCCFTVRLPRA